MQFDGPQELSDALLRSWNSELHRHALPISENGARNLLHLAFHASQTEDEGRPSRFRLVASDNFSWLVQFDRPVPITGIETLRRLGQSVSLPDSALAITELGSSGEMACIGICSLTTMTCARPAVGHPWILSIPSRPILVIDVRGAGHVSAEVAPESPFILRHGRVRDSLPYDQVPQVSDWLERLAFDVRQRVVHYIGEIECELLEPSVIKVSMMRVWSEVLSCVLGARHGGAFVILPEDLDPADPIAERYEVACRFDGTVDLAARFAVLLIACVEMTQASSVEEHDSVTHRWADAWQTLAAEARAVADLANVDGCVVFDRSLDLAGFGGEIHTKRSDAVLPLLQRSRETLVETDLEAFGTRHRSAARLCSAHPGVIAFVISQDGELRVFASDQQAAFRYDDLDAWPALRVSRDEIEGMQQG